MVTRPGSPPKVVMYLWIHLRATRSVIMRFQQRQKQVCANRTYDLLDLYFLRPLPRPVFQPGNRRLKGKQGACNH